MTEIDTENSTSVEPNWIDTHSVTCAFCGGLADERETASLWQMDYGGTASDVLLKFVREQPGGEAHRECFENEYEAWKKGDTDE